MWLPQDGKVRREALPPKKIRRWGIPTACRSGGKRCSLHLITHVVWKNGNRRSLGGFACGFTAGKQRKDVIPDICKRAVWEKAPTRKNGRRERRGADLCLAYKLHKQHWIVKKIRPLYAFRTGCYISHPAAFLQRRCVLDRNGFSFGTIADYTLRSICSI